jgi:putative transposase
MEEVWEIMMAQLKLEIKEHSLGVHAFVLMGNHFHLLCHTPKANLDVIMQRFLRTTSVKINQRTKTINHLWGGRYKWSLIDNQSHYFQVYRYIFQNPVRARICERVEDYPYSTLRPCSLPIHSFVPMSFGGSEGELLWLNEPYDKDDIEAIRCALRKSQFDIGKRRLKTYKRLNPPPRPSSSKEG